MSANPVTATCALCGATSTLPELFLRGPTGPNRRGLLCPRCFDEVLASYHKWRLQGILLVIALGALFVASGFEQFGVVMATFSIGCVFTVLLTPLHELAHALAALLLGLPVYRLVIGWYGKPLARFHVGRCAVEVKRVPVGGATYTAHPTDKLIRTRELLVVLAGPLLHCVLLYGTWVVIQQAEDFRSVPDSIYLLAVIFGLANAFEIMLNLWPRRYRSPWGDVPSDGLALATIPFAPQAEIDKHHLAWFHYECGSLLRERNEARAMELCQSGLDRFPGDITLQYFEAWAHLGQADFAAARRGFSDLCQHPETTGAYRAMLLTAIAWTDLVSWDPTALKHATESSREAIEALPWQPQIKGTRGSVLVVAGQVQGGTSLLREAFAENDDPEYKALNAAFLALGSARMGNVDEAHQFLRTAERLDPRCDQLERIRKEVVELAGGGAFSRSSL